MERAAECFEKALAVNPLAASSWFTFGCVRLQQRQFEAAVTAFRRSATLEPDNFQAWANLSTALVQTKQKCGPFTMHICNSCETGPPPHKRAFDCMCNVLDALICLLTML